MDFFLHLHAWFLPTWTTHHTEESLDATESRDQPQELPLVHKLIPETLPQLEETIRTVRQQIHFQHISTIEEIHNTPSYICKFSN